MLRLQSDVAQAIAAASARTKSAHYSSRSRFRSTRAVNPEAYEAYLQGRFYMTNLFSRPQDLTTARVLL